MRRILVERARRRGSVKHGGRLQRMDLDVDCVAVPDNRDDLLALDEALTKLAQEDAELAEVVKLLYFAGLTLGQIAEIMGVARRIADRHWALRHVVRGINSARLLSCLSEPDILI